MRLLAAIAMESGASRQMDTIIHVSRPASIGRIRRVKSSQGKSRGGWVTILAGRTESTRSACHVPLAALTRQILPSP